jgi:hypothetical protein
LSPGDGVYSLTEPGGAPYQAYCDMSTDGGGWTAVFAGTNGSVNVFDHFDAGSYAGTCTDPATHCLRRAPSSLAAATELAVSCDAVMVKFSLTPEFPAPVAAIRNWLMAGTQGGWQGLTATRLAGSVSRMPNSLFTGDASRRSFIFARDGGAFGSTFASSSENTITAYDYCNGVPDQNSLVRVFYR